MSAVPSDRVQSGTFGACLMREPEVVAEAIARDEAGLTRAGDGQMPDRGGRPGCRRRCCRRFWQRMVGAGADAIWIHARKAWLQGLSPKENRDIPPLDYPLVYRMKRENPDVFIGINGGIATLDEALAHLQHVDGVMIGRAAYHHAAMLTEVDARIYGEAVSAPDWDRVRDRMMDYAEAHMARGGRLNQVTRHMVGLFQGVTGARRFRQILSTEATKPGAGPEVIHEAFAAVDLAGVEAILGAQPLAAE